MNPSLSSRPTIYLPTLLARQGGAWLGAARTWMQTRFKNGERVTWGSNDPLEGAPVTVADIEAVAACAAAAALNDPPRDSIAGERRERYDAALISLRAILIALPVNRDWLDPQVEAVAHKLVKEWQT